MPNLQRYGQSKKEMRQLSLPEYETLIENWVFSERDRAIMKRKLLDAVTYERISEEYELSVSQVKRIVKKWRTVLLAHLK